MILDFALENYGPFRDRSLFSLQATKFREHPENVAKVPGVENGILTSALVFGSNASGKSYLLKSIKVLRMLVGQDNARSASSSFDFYQPFRLSGSSLAKPIKIEIRIATGGEIYEYIVSFDSNSIVEERLSLLTDEDKIIFTRQGGEIDARDCVNVSDKTSPYMPYLTVATKFNDTKCKRVFEEIMNIVFLDGGTIRNLIPQSYEFIKKDAETSVKAIRALKVADFAISGIKGRYDRVELEKIKGSLPPGLYDQLVRNSDSLDTLRIELTHSFTDVPPELSDFPLEIESNGTCSMLALLGPVIDSLKNGRTIVIDEFGAYLHPEITRWLVGLFDLEQNGNMGQLIACTQEIGLMDLSMLRRDQIYFTDKDMDHGCSTLYSLSDFKGIRTSDNIMRDYLVGKFDAVPVIHRGGRI